MEQPSSTTPASSMIQSVLDSSMVTFLKSMGSLSRLLHGSSDETEDSGDGASISQGEPQRSGFGASATFAADGSERKQDIASEQKHAPGLTATPPTILELVEVYLKRQQSEIKVKASVWKSVLEDLRNHEKAYLRGGRPRPKNLEIKALANACIALDVGLTSEGFNSFCKELLKVEGSDKRDLSDMGQLKKLLQVFCETSGQSEQTATVIFGLPQ